jgi:NADPH-dependent glutamate synthase beta subunit-like oxidoreductase
MISDINIKIDRDLCFACGICVDRCILDNLRLSVAPCRQACPLNLNCQGYVRLITQGKEEDAAKELRKYTPFAGILGRLCSRPCETACERGQTVGDGAVNIRALKRYLDDKYPEITRQAPEIGPGTGLKAVVIGSGPAGLMAAYELGTMGHQVTILETQLKPGGLLRYGIPGFRLPPSEIDAAVKFLEGMGVEFRLGCKVGKDIEWEELEKNYGAIIAAIGAAGSMLLNVPGDDQAGVVSGLALLAKAKNGQAPDLSGKSVVVVGGGNSAADTAVTCLHCGASKVLLVCLENPHEMPAYAAELNEARQLGVIIENCWGVSRIDRTPVGKLTLCLNRCLSVFDPEGNFAPQLDDTSGLHSIEADMVALAIGQSVESSGLPASLLDTVTGRFAYDEITRQTRQNPKVFACGDCAQGPSSVVEAFASGKRAAESAGRYLRGENLSYEHDYYLANGLVTEYQALPERAVGGPRQNASLLPLEKRGLNEETELGLSQAEAKREAERCLNCGRPFEFNMTCWYCLPCEIECPSQALYVRMPYQVR